MNGRLPDAHLAPIPGSGPYGPPRLRTDAAAAYRALHARSLQRFGVSMALHEGVVGRAYRSLKRQVLAKRIYGRDAAVPGRSNHGLGLAVDLMSRRQRWVVDMIGAEFGFAKRWSDASWEWWHIRWRAGVWKPPPRRPVLRYGSRGSAVRRLQRLLRARGYKSVKVTGFYGAATRKAVWRFQRKKGLRADGVCGPATWRALRRKG